MKHEMMREVPTNETREGYYDNDDLLKLFTVT
jgi:hypothetical protein